MVHVSVPLNGRSVPTEYFDFFRKGLTSSTRNSGLALHPWLARRVRRSASEMIQVLAEVCFIQSTPN